MIGRLYLLLCHWPLTAAMASAAALAVAIASEIFGGLLPCSLCLSQRRVLILAAVVGSGGWLVSRWRLADRWPVNSLTCLALALVFGGSAVLAGYHAGVEWGWFAGPAACSAGRLEIDSLIDQLRKPMETVSCSQAAVRIAGLSMAGWNGVFSAVLAGCSLYAAGWKRRAGDGMDEKTTR